MTGIKPADPALFASYDVYAAQRCACKHLVYADDKPGGSCRFCACTDHQVAGRAA